MADRCHIEKCWKCYNSPTNGPICTKLEWPHRIMFLTRLTCSPSYGCHGNGRCVETAH